MANQAVYGIVANRAKAERLIQALVDAGVNPQEVSFLSAQGEEFQELQSTTPSSMSESNRNWRIEERITDYPAGTSGTHMTHNGSTSQGSSGYGSTSHGSTSQGSSTHGYGSTGHNGSGSQGSTGFGSTSQGSTSQGSTHQGGMGTEKHTKAPEGATTGAVTGGIIGGTLGLLAGLGALAIPGVGPFIAAGPIMATLAGIGSGGTAGGIIGALVGSGIPEYEAKRYGDRLKGGGILVAIRANNDDRAKQIKDILQKNGAEDVSISSEASMSKDYKKNK